MSENRSITTEARPVVELLSKFVARPDITAILKDSQAKAILQLNLDPSLSAAVDNIDLKKISDPVAGIGSIRVAVIRAGFDGGNERHANSTQYLFSLEGRGETHVKEENGWRIDKYGLGSSLEDRFHVVPVGIWHKSAAPGSQDWTVVAFHTAAKVEDDYNYSEEST